MAASTQITSCCFCIKLKPGVVFISLIWLIYGILETAQNSLLLITSNKRTSVYSYVYPFVIPVTINYGLITIGAAFGLFAVTCSRTVKMLTIYTKIAYVIVGAEIVSRALVICLVIRYKSRFIEDCIRSISKTSSRIEYSADACNQGYIFSLTFSIAFAVLTILFTLYFAIIISSYARKRRDKVAAIAAKNSDEIDE
ncbi:hypothetical protein RhiirA5_210671 [Rhizophagus irregularis]|uniref:MARVEL domain-containing protein n=4 Tax=Rhizophagus irregularis TaxID=588596 RepID=A0A2I1EXG5_9GLOM|nr:hypothetical protein GLOIN_2v1721677 [Rhizophagus irregularis DAOM 181602=DAOM 197198]EXX78322.1 hypothetical protein RirG_016010 [Rhizophagus irregularis DAOM 197198w]PKC06260.1 hypothetical protein RhiirA5_210671 [Rhizophagus irregularis]PKC60425.1 hypothetical protein RhiirA1_425929 [Rhizophagus irregularis]PKK72181.1 hypothetical protein RhiirC2_743244 [Rhizophagus irregularis]PKY26804.1 hypothetical protein RhiirB3_442246 [Rhizophagus irregularis]|eukprot:XP_025166354.1 hypothetical protein GLOIN_2v1721677 [Rhizophagus irregularis DAOM 181602=DAOM 197198]